MNILQREPTLGMRDGGYKHLVKLISRCHESERKKRRHRRTAAQMFRGLREAGIVDLKTQFGEKRKYVTTRENLQREFSLHQTLSLYLLYALEHLDKTGDEDAYALDLVSVVEAILENPRAILIMQEKYIKREMMGDMKARGVPYEERIEKLDQVTYEKPMAEFLYNTFNVFKSFRPWLRNENVRPKSIGRDILERYASFNEFVTEYQLQRIEGVLLRYLSQLYKALLQSVPEEYRNDAFIERIAFLRTTLANADSSLISEWEALVSGSSQGTKPTTLQPKKPVDITLNKKSFYARIRAELYAVIKALSQRNAAQAILSIRQGDDPDQQWDEARMMNCMGVYYRQYNSLVADHRARYTDLTFIEKSGLRQWRIRHSLVDPAQENEWYLDCQIDLEDLSQDTAGPIIVLNDICK